MDDDPEVANLLRIVLTLRGYQALGACDGDDALNVARSYAGSIDLLVTDVSMPGSMDGVELAIRLMDERAGIRVVLMSALPSGEIASAGLPFLPKPFLPEEACEVIDRVFDTAPPPPQPLCRRLCPLHERPPSHC